MPESIFRETWEAALHEHFDREYEAKPLPTVQQLSPVERFHMEVANPTIYAWLTGLGPQLIKERDILSDSFGVECKPLLILLSDTPGLVTIHTSYQYRPERVFYLPHASFQAFLDAYPDEKQRWHVVYSCYFTDQLESSLLARATSKYRLKKKEQYWLHYEVSTLAPLFERAVVHLWKWNGRKQTLLEEAFHGWIS